MTRERHHGCRKISSPCYKGVYEASCGERCNHAGNSAFWRRTSISMVDPEDLTSIKKRVETEEVAQQQWEDQEMVLER